MQQWHNPKISHLEFLPWLSSEFCNYIPQQRYYRQAAEYLPTNKCATIFGFSYYIFEFDRSMQSEWATYLRVLQSSVVATSPNVELQLSELPWLQNVQSPKNQSTREI
jgi:hypothetical protein